MGTRGTVEIAGDVKGTLEDMLELTGESTIPKSIPPSDISYNVIKDKPSINTYTVEGDKLGIDYNLQDKMDVLTVQEIEKILYGFGI